MTFALGDQVTKKPCPAGCNCDGNMIPPGTEGVISIAQYGAPEIQDSWYRRREASYGRIEDYYHVKWIVRGSPKYWWTFEHGLESCGNFPDELWIS